MTINNIYNLLNEISPFMDQEEWDNSGVLVGSLDDYFDNIYLSLDVDSNTLRKCKKNSLIITHHPLIFDPLKKINPLQYPSNIIKYMIKNNLYLIAMHTNFDKTHLNRFVASKILGYEEVDCKDFICSFRVEKSFLDFLKNIKDVFNLKFAKIVKTKEFISSASLVTGSGMSLAQEITTDCFLTGDIKYHQAIESKENGLSLIDIGHFESEVYFAKCMRDILGSFSIKASIIDFKNPFDFI